jgi:hypothetical protein
MPVWLPSSARRIEVYCQHRNEQEIQLSKLLALSNKTFRFYSDPGHGWIAVKVSCMQAINPEMYKQISEYSYINGGTAYLEEDCDYQVFAQMYAQVFGYKPQIDIISTDKPSRIRGYFRFTDSEYLRAIRDYPE